MPSQSTWPALPRSAWAATSHTLHMYTQMVGKIQLALTPFECGWANAPLSLTARGLATSVLPYGEHALQIDFDFITHTLNFKVSDGASRSISLIAKRSVADFFEEIQASLHALDIEVRIRPVPAEVSNPVPFTQDRAPAPYDPEYAQRFWRILLEVQAVFNEHRAAFGSRHTSTQFFWGTFDLAYARFSGHSAPPPPNADVIARAAMDAQEIEAGFWPGDDRFPEPAFYCFAHPKPPGIEQAAIRPAHAFWSDKLGEFLLRYEDVRGADSPRAAILDFLRSTYDACAMTAGWERVAINGAQPS